MKKYLIAIFWLLILFTSCNNNKTDHNGNLKTKEVENFIVEYYAVMSARNWTAYQDFFSENAILTTIWKDSSETKEQIFTSTISEFIAQTANGPDSQPIFEEQPIKIEIDIKNKLASVWVKYKAKFGSETELVEWNGYDLFSLIKFEGKWKITSLTFLEISE